MTDSPQDREPPRLQDTTERAALPLPLPGRESGQWSPPQAAAEQEPREPAPVEPPAEEPATVEWGAPEVAADPEPSPPPEEPEPQPEPEPAPEPTPEPAPEAPPYEPAPTVSAIGGEAEAGPRPELLVGAAFVGGLALAFLIKRLGS